VRFVPIVLTMALTTPAHAQSGWMSVEPTDPIDLLGCYDEAGAAGEAERGLLTFRNVSEQRIVRVFPEGPEWIAVLLDPVMDKEHRELYPGDAEVVRLASNCLEGLRDEIDAAWDGFGSCVDYTVAVEVDGAEVERHEVEACLFCKDGNIEISDPDRIRLVGTDGCPATGSFEVSNTGPVCPLRNVKIEGPDGFDIDPSSFSVTAAGVDPEVIHEHTRTVQVTAPCRDQPPVRTETLSITSSDHEHAAIDLQVTVECGPPTTEIVLGRYPKVVQTELPRRDLQFSVVAGHPTPPLTLDFRGAPGCSPKRWFECGEGTIHDPEIPASAPGPTYQVPFLACYGHGEGPGTLVDVVGHAVLVDANECESKPVDFVYACQF